MPTIQRPLKTYGTRSYVTEVAAAPSNEDPILANEVDADLDTVYTAWNNTLAQGIFWQISGATLTPIDTTKTVSVPAGSVIVGSRTIKHRLHAHPTTDIGYLASNVISNPTNTAWVQDDVSRPSWLAACNAASDLFGVYRIPAGQTAIPSAATLFFIDSTGKVTLPAAIPNLLEFGSRASKGRLVASTVSDTVALSVNAALNAAGTAYVQDTAQSAWILSLRAGADLFTVDRLSGAGALTTPLSLDGGGTLSISNMVNWNTGNAATGGQGTLANYTTVGVRIGVNDRWAPPAPTQPSWSLEMQAAGSGAVQLFHRLANAASGSADHSFLFNYNGNYVITGTYAEKATGTLWAVPSDRRLKDAITDYATGLAAIVQLRPRTFVYNGKGGSRAGMRGYGFIADEIAPLMPEMVGVRTGKLDPEDEDETDIQTLDQSNLILALVNAVKELATRVTGLET